MSLDVKGNNKMRTAGIICEYNPFHTGHQRQINLLRERGVDTVVCLMSGNVTQRGSFACADKYIRAAAALAGGADLVLELPYPYSAAGAEFFAAAGVSILDALGVDEINFGSECGDADELKAVASVTSGTAFTEAYRAALRNETSSGSAEVFSALYRKLTGKELPCRPNDLLAAAYFRAAERSGADAELTVTKRVGADYSVSVLESGEHPSATGLRELLRNGDNEAAFSYMPEGTAAVFRKAYANGDFPADAERIGQSFLTFFRLCNPQALANIAEAGGGVAGRLASAARNAVEIEEMFAQAATKRYTDSRLRRAALFCLTGVTAEDIRTTPAYTSLLAANRRGREFLSADRSRGITIVTKPADAVQCRQRVLSERLDSLFTLTLPRPLPADEFLRRSPKISEND